MSSKPKKTKRDEVRDWLTSLLARRYSISKKHVHEDDALSHWGLTDTHIAELAGRFNKKPKLAAAMGLVRPPDLVKAVQGQTVGHAIDFLSTSSNLLSDVVLASDTIDSAGSVADQVGAWLTMWLTTHPVGLTDADINQYLIHNDTRRVTFRDDFNAKSDKSWSRRHILNETDLANLNGRRGLEDFLIPIAT